MPAALPLYMTEQFLDFLRLLERNGGRYQARMESLQATLDLTPNTMRKIKAQATQLRLITVSPQGASFGIGRLPDIYTLRVTAAEWIATRDDYHAEVLAKRREKSVATRKKNIAKAKLQKSLDREKAEREAAAERRQERVVRAYPKPGPAIPAVPKSEVDRIMREPDLDVDAWADFD